MIVICSMLKVKSNTITILQVIIIAHKNSDISSAIISAQWQAVSVQIINKAHK